MKVMAKSKSNSNSKKDLSVQHRKSPAVKRMIVELVDSGKMTGIEASQKYGVSTYAIQQWRSVVAAGRSLVTRQYDKALKLRIIHEINSGLLTIEEAVKKYDINYVQVIHRWMKAAELSSCSPMSKPSQTGSEKPETESLESENARLRKELEDAKLRVLGLESLIEVAEEELEIKIRKKSGTKQLKK